MQTARSSSEASISVFSETSIKPVDHLSAVTLSPRMNLLLLLNIAFLVWSGTVLSRSFVTSVEYSPFWPVSGIALAVATLYGLRWAQLVIPMIAAWALLFHHEELLNVVVLTCSSCVLPIMVGIWLRKKLGFDNADFELSLSTLIRFYLVGLLAVALPSSLLSSTVAAFLNIFSDVAIVDLALVYWLSEFAGIVLFFPVLFLPAFQPKWLTESQSRLSIITSITIVSFMIAGYFLPGFYKQIAVFLCLPVLSYYALRERNPWHLHLLVMLWVVLSLFVIREIPVSEGTDNEVLFVSGFMLLFAGCVVTLHIIWLVSYIQRRLTEDLIQQSLHDTRTQFLNHRGLTEQLNDQDNKFAYGMIARIQQSKEMIESMGLQLMPRLLSEVASRINKTIDADLTIGVIGGSSLVVLIPKNSGKVSFNGCSTLFQNLTRDAYLPDRSLSLKELDLAILEVDSSQQKSLLESLVVAAHFASQNMIRRMYFGHTTDDCLNQPVADFRRFQTLKKYLDDGRLEMWAQPIVAASNTELREKKELLARIRHPDGHMLPPAEFMPLFEQFGFQSEFDKYVLEESLKSLPRKPTSTYTINISAEFFAQQEFSEFVIALMQNLRIKPEWFSLEVTESDVIPNIEITRKNIRTLNNEGIQVGLDDFGTGFATHSCLLDIQFNFVKIDGRFIKDIDKNPASRATVESILTLARNLDMYTVAEFVESEEILHCLQELGVHYLQGYAIGKPAPIDKND